jgi:hypothetical protein
MKGYPSRRVAVVRGANKIPRPTPLPIPIQTLHVYHAHNAPSTPNYHHVENSIHWTPLTRVHPMSSASSPRTAAHRPAPLACDECRRKHLKCDGSSPICRRCVQEGLTCIYTASRRGRARRSKRNEVSTNHSAIESDNNNNHHLNRDVNNIGNVEDSTAAATVDHARTNLASPLVNNTLQSLDAYNLPSLQSITPATPYTWSLNTVDRERLISLFYTNFYPAHPFLVPSSFYHTRQYPYYLDLMVCFVGHYFTTPLADAVAFRNAVHSAMTGIDEQTPCRVQALVLYAITLHSLQQPKEAVSCITRAANIALQLGMNEPSFARTNAANSAVVEESLRRTWWELYTVDVYISAIHRHPTFATAGTTPLPLLPCAQSMFEEGQCDPNPPTLRAFENRVFSLDPRNNFSSMCFRIDAIRIVGRVSALAATGDASQDSIQSLDNAIASWEYNLPPLFTDFVGPSGEIDLMLFQARCFISCASIFLHFPRSALPDTVPTANDIACAKGYTQIAPTSRHHTIKAIAASKTLSNLATTPWPLERHSPFFVCGLVLGCIIQLAAGSIHLHQCGLDCLQQHRDRVVLMLGALQRMGERWVLAQNAVRCLKIVAEAVFSAGGDDGATSSQARSFLDSAMDDGESASNPLWFDLFSMDNMQNNFFDV